MRSLIKTHAYNRFHQLYTTGPTYETTVEEDMVIELVRKIKYNVGSNIIYLHDNEKQTLVDYIEDFEPEHPLLDDVRNNVYVDSIELASVAEKYVLELLMEE